MMGIDWNLRVLLQLAADPQPVQAGQHDVQEDQVRRLGLHGRQGILARRHAGNLIPLLQQVVADQFPDVLLVLHDEYGLLNHAQSPSLATLRPKGMQTQIVLLPR